MIQPHLLIWTVGSKMNGEQGRRDLFSCILNKELLFNWVRNF